MKGNLLGPLESKVMTYIWRENKPVSISSIHTYLLSQDKLAYTTVSTIVSRLEDKGLLKRSKLPEGNVYQSALTELEFKQAKSRGLIRSILGSFGDIAIAGFVEEIKTDPKSLRKL